MPDRDAARRSFLQSTPWANWTQNALPVDASTRSYLRLSDGTANVILMDADPANGQDTRPFTRVADWLLRNGFSPPRILKADTKHGFLVLEDLGLDDFASYIRNDPRQADTLYGAAIDVLVALDSKAPPSGLPAMSAQAGGKMLDVTCTWYTKTANSEELMTTMAEHLAQFCGPPERIALRDFHVENLIWRPQKSSHARVGLLDFQDAFIAPRGYDLVSLLRDVRRDVDPTLAAKMTARFIAATNADPAQTTAALACLAVQRNLRILGVFARLAQRDCKLRYLQWVPHVWSLIQDDLRHPELRHLKNAVQRNLPPPNQSAIKDFL